MRKISYIFCILISLLLLHTACGKLSVTWLDGDGGLLYSEKIEKDAPIPEKPLPDDNDDWDYIEWRVSDLEAKSPIFTAYREAKIKYEWRDADGKIINKTSLKKDEAVPSIPLPADTESYDYTEWKQSLEGDITVFTAVRFAGKTVYWKDADGSVLYTAFVRNGDAAPERFIPNDTSDWHYVDWAETEYGFVANRIAKEKIHWLDVDGKELFVDGVIPGEEIKMREFPTENKKWLYTEWADVTEAGGEKTFIAIADLNPQYFSGNVFQVVAKDIYGKPQKLGSGFVFNSSGWFITNYHVIEGAVSADAIFEIEDYLMGDSYTTLKISHAYYSSPEKDIFIGKIDDYKKISSHYQSIPMVRDYEVGDKVYSVGYPGGSMKMEIHEGEVVDEGSKKVNSLYNKLSKGVTYIPNTAYIAPGSSGGILINEKLEVIGITKGIVLSEKNEFSLGAAIRVFNFQNTANGVNTKNAKNFIDFFYPLEADVIKFFQMGETHENCQGLFSDYSGTYYQYMFEYEHKTGKDSTEGNETVVILVYDDGRVVCTRVYEWRIGHVSTSILAGYYSGNPSSINSFDFATTYMWPSGYGYTVSSDNINYSSDHKKSLADCEITPIGNVSVSEGHKDNARSVFNNTYDRLLKFFNSVK